MNLPHPSHQRKMFINILSLFIWNLSKLNFGDWFMLNLMWKSDWTTYLHSQKNFFFFSLGNVAPTTTPSLRFPHSPTQIRLHWGLTREREREREREGGTRSSSFRSKKAPSLSLSLSLSFSKCPRLSFSPLNVPFIFSPLWRAEEHMRKE